jgi:3-deoxy-D-manno-octulosonic-acid transferase
LALILIESEIWPELLRAAERRSVPVILAAGRLGSKAMRHFRPFASLVKPIFSSMALIAAISQGDLERFLELGAREERAKVLGNPKFDALIALAREGAFEDPREGEGPLDIVAGSTHPGEEGLIIRAFLSARDSYRSRADGKKKALRLILAPRHPLRAPEALKEASDCGLSAGYIQNPLDPEGYGLEVGLVDRLGLLNLFYRRSLISLVGGSFFPAYQGHNPLEPAAFARPIICGPFMESFAQEAKELREAGAAFIAKDGPELADVLASLLNNPDLAQESGRKGRAALAQRPEAGPLYAKAIQRILDAEKARL